MKDYFSNRRTVRQYSDKEVPAELLNDILRRASKAPTTGNMQLYSVIVTRDGETRKNLEALHFNQPASTGGKVILTVCADFNMFSRWCELSDADPGYDNLLSFFSAMTDATVLTQQIVTIAEMEGLGTCYLGTVLYNADKISELLNLPDLVVPVCSISIGYPAGGAGEESERLPIEAWVHEDKYDNYSDKRLLELYAAKDDYEPNRRYVEENNKKTLAQVFTDIRYPRGLNESVSEKLVELLKAKRFMR